MLDTLDTVKKIFKESDRPLRILVIGLPKDKSVEDLSLMVEAIDFAGEITSTSLREEVGGTAYRRGNITADFFRRIMMLNTGVKELDKLGFYFWTVYKGKPARGNPPTNYVATGDSGYISCSDGGVVFSFLIDKEETEK